MSITYNADVGLQVDAVSTVRADIADIFKKAFATNADLPELNVEPETPAGQLIDAITVLLMEKDNEIAYLANMFNPATAEGVWQDAMAAIYFINRIVKSCTTVTCRCTGLYGTVIPYYAVVQDVNGYQYVNTQAVTIGSAGYVDAIFRCSTYGPVEVDAGSVNSIVTVVPGWDSVINETSGATGRNAESQAAFEIRRRQCVAKNAHGTADSVLGTVADLNDVVACAVIQNRTDSIITKFGVNIAPHSIYLSVYGGDNDEIAEAIYNKLDAGCGTNGNTEVTYTDDDGDGHSYYIEVPNTVEMGIVVTVGETDSLPADYEDKVKAAVLSNFEGETDYARVKMAEVLYASRFYSDIIDSGVDRLIVVKIVYPLSGGTEYDSVEIPADELPVLSESDITVEVVA